MAAIQHSERPHPFTGKKEASGKLGLIHNAEIVYTMVSA